MATMSIRGIDRKAVDRLKRQARSEGSSLNKLAVRLLQGEAPKLRGAAALQTYEDLDALAGTWTSRQAYQFEHGIAAFSEIDSALWK